MRVLDTNVFIRFLTGDDPAKASASRALFQAMDRGEQDLFASEAVVAEIIYVLTSKKHYGLSRVDATDRLRPALAVRGLHMSEKLAAISALDIFVTYPFLDFEDALSVAHARAQTTNEVVSYDRGFSRVDGISRIEPSPA